MLFYCLWVPSIIIIMCFTAFLSWKTNATGDNKWMGALFLLSLVQIWPIIAKMSKNLFFDGLLFDILLIVSYTVAAGIFTGAFSSFKLYHWIALVFVIAGLAVLKIK